MKQMLTLVLLATNIFAMAQEKRNLIETHHLKGRVKTIKEIPYNAEEQDGKIIKITQGKPTIGRYDEYGNVVEESTIAFADYPLTVKYNNKYGDKNNLAETKVNISGSINMKIGYEYDDKNRLISVKIYSENESEPYYQEVNKYNEGRKIEEDLYSEGEFARKWRYTYDKKGNKIEATAYTPDGVVDDKVVYQYDDKDNIVGEWNCYDDSCSNRIYTYKYTKYDAKGNWIERLEYFSEKLSSITEREIEYYQ